MCYHDPRLVCLYSSVLREHAALSGSSVLRYLALRQGKIMHMLMRRVHRVHRESLGRLAVRLDGQVAR